MSYIKFPKHSGHLALGDHDRRLVTRLILTFPNNATDESMTRLLQSRCKVTYLSFDSSTWSPVKGGPLSAQSQGQNAHGSPIFVISMLSVIVPP